MITRSRFVQPITPFALSAYLDSLKAEGYTILLVREHLACPLQGDLRRSQALIYAIDYPPSHQPPAHLLANMHRRRSTEHIARRCCCNQI